MSDLSEDDRRSESNRSDDEIENDENFDVQGILGAVNVERSKTQFHVSSIPNELGDEELISFDVQNDVMVFVGVSGKVIVRDTKDDHDPISTLIPSAYKGFVSPDGHHVFVSSLDGNLYYFSLQNRKALASQKVNKDTGSKQAMVVESVCWPLSSRGQAITTGTVLLGSKSGAFIFSTRVDVSASPAVATFTFCRHVLQLPENDNSPIHGLKVMHNSSIHSTLIMVTTPSRMYPFVGKDRRVNKRHVPLTEEEVLRMYKNGKQCEILDMGVKSNLTKGTLSVIRPSPREDALSFVWLSTTGISHGIFNKRLSTSDVLIDDVSDSESDDMRNYECEFGDVDESAEVSDQFANQCHIPIGQRGVGTSGALTMANNTMQRQSSRIPSTPPVDVAASAFHMFLLYENRMIVIGHPAGLSWRPHATSACDQLSEIEINGRIRYDPYENRAAKGFIGITRDESTRRVFYYNKFSVFELTVENEHVGQWKLFLKQAIDKSAEKSFRMRAFEAALKLSFGNAARRDLVTYAYGKFLIELRAYQRAASMLALCNRFEEIFVFLRDLRKPIVLVDFLEKRYNFLLKYRDNKKGGSLIPFESKRPRPFLNSTNEFDETEPYIGSMESQLMCLLCAIIQLKLEFINRIEANPDHNRVVLAKELDSLKRFTLSAVDVHKAAMQRPAINNTIGRLFTAHGRVDLMLAFSEKLGQVRYAIHFFISRERFEEACKLLIDRCSMEGEEDVWYAFAPRLIQHVPIQLINGMNNFKINKRSEDGRRTDTLVRALDPARLIPAFVHYRPEMNELQNGRRPEGHKVIPYLRNAIRQDKNMNPLVHNFYVSLLAEFDVEILRSFLQQDDGADYTRHCNGENEGRLNGNHSSVPRSTAYDPEYALRQCIKFHRHQYCVPLYKRLGLYEDAIAIALESSRPIREGGKDDGHLSWDGLTLVTDEILDTKPEWMDLSTFKELWLSVARRVIEKVGTRDTLSVVERSRGVLKLEDILPDIGDSTVIQDFKEAIVNALNEYTDSITIVKQKEEEAKRVSSNIRREIDTLQSRFGYVSSKQQCMLCHQGVFGGSSDKPFLVFPNCKHVFHESCVRSRMTHISAFSLLKAESDELPTGYLDGVVNDEDVGSLECIYCGECAIAEITAPMVVDGSSWDVPEFSKR